MMFTQRHYKAIADVISRLPSSPTKGEIITAFGFLFHQDNPKFKYELFGKRLGYGLGYGALEYELFIEAWREKKKVKRSKKS